MSYCIGIYHVIGHIKHVKPIFRNYHTQSRLPNITPLFKKRKYQITSKKQHQTLENTANGNNNISQNHVYENIEDSTDETDTDPSNFKLTTTIGSVRVPLGVTSIDGDDDFDFVESGDLGIKAAAKSRSVFEVLRITKEGKSKRIYVKRRDLIRAYNLKPRDLRRIDPAWNRSDTSQSIVVKESCFLVALGGVRCIVSQEKALLFECDGPASKKFLKFIIPRLQSYAGKKLLKTHIQSYNDNDNDGNESENYGNDQQTTPFELDILEGTLIVATGYLDAELITLMRRASAVLTSVPAEVNPINLEEIRRTKQACVELEAKAQALREVLEEILDDDEELIRVNLSHRPSREARQKIRERNKLKREQLQGGKLSFPTVEEALAEMDDVEEQERELEEIEDMLEYYMQRAGITLAETDRVLAGARDLEESIGVSLSARRFEVNRLELMLSMGSFAAALGAVLSGIFGMNLRSNIEYSIYAFYGVTGLIVIGCFYIFFALYLYTKRRSIV